MPVASLRSRPACGLAVLLGVTVCWLALAPHAAAGATSARGTASWVLSEQAPGEARVGATRSLAKTGVAKVGRKVRKRPVRRPAPTPSPPLALLPNDPRWQESWSLTRVNLPAAWSLTTGAAESVVAVLDTGADLGHPDLQGAFVAGIDTVNEDADPSDDHGHGTMVAGVIAARGNNGIGGAGACWRCTVMPVKVIGADGSGNAVDVAEGIIWAADHGARVINLSFTMTAPDDGVREAIEHARNQGAVVVAAAGNTGTADVAYPAAFPGVVSVAGTDAADARYDWSSHGRWVSVAAPGCNVTTSPGGGYGDFCGTSSAAAFVSGLAALARSYAPSLSADAVGLALLVGATPVGDFVAGGRVNAAGVLSSLRAP